MARLESDREDLIAEAKALVQRAEFEVPGQQAGVIVGYRRDGALSMYFGSDPCYHFDREMRLRRAFVEGALYRTQGHTLARLQRLRTGQTVELIRHDLTDAERDAFCENVADRLQRVDTALKTSARRVQEVPAGAGLQTRLVGSLEQLLSRPIVLAPAIRGKR